MAKLFTFPHPVNEVAARAVATGVVVMTAALLLTRQWWLLVPITFGFVARVAAGPRFSPLGQLATRVIAPRLASRRKLVPGPPKRFAQSIGAVLSLGATASHLAGHDGTALVMIAMITVAATLEAALALCLGCQIFNLLIRTGLVPERVCLECSDLSRLTPV